MSMSNCCGPVPFQGVAMNKAEAETEAAALATAVIQACMTV